MNYRGYLINAYPSMPNLLKIAVEGQGGRIPGILDGLHTSHGSAKALIDHYLDNLKEAPSGKTSTKIRD